MKIISTDKAPAAIGPYSQAVLANGVLYCSGQIPLNPETGLIEGETAAEQTARVIRNIEAVLRQAGMDFPNVVKTTAFLADMADFAAFNEVYEKSFVSKPARSCVAVKALPRGALVEIEVLAVLEK